MKIKDITNKKFGKLFILKFNGVDKNRHSLWLCKCDCGKEIIIKRPSLISGQTKSCGCLYNKHGMYKSREYVTWKDMMCRCYNKNHKKYKNYGGRGIQVCKKWHNFKGFYEDMGNKPIGLTLDKINNDLDYSKENCRWADYYIQANNTTKNHFYNFNGKTQTIAQWSRETSIPYTTLRKRIINNKPLF